MTRVVYLRQWRQDNKAKVYVYHRRNNLKKKYGITQEQYEELYYGQQGRCKICDKEVGNQFSNSTGSPATVDHCHKTGAIRGLLCGGCNSGIGKLKDDPELLRKGAEYLEDSLRHRDQRN